MCLFVINQCGSVSYVANKDFYLDLVFTALPMALMLILLPASFDT